MLSRQLLVFVALTTTSHAIGSEWLCRIFGKISPGRRTTAPPVSVAVAPPPLRDSTAIQTPKEGSLIPTDGRRYLNGTIVDATDPQGRRRRLLLLSDYLHGHSAHLGALPDGWKLDALVHRGEYETRNGEVVRVNATSGQAHLEGVDNPLAEAERYLAHSKLAPKAEYLPFVEGREHLYDGFNEPDGRPVGLHSKRARVIVAFGHVIDYLDIDWAERLVEKKDLPQTVLDHWDIFTAGVPDAQTRYAMLKGGLEGLVQGTKPTDDARKAMVADLKALRERTKRVEIVELPVLAAPLPVPALQRR